MSLINYWKIYREYRTKYPDVSRREILKAASSKNKGIGRPAMALHWKEAKYLQKEYGITIGKARYHAKYRAKGFEPMEVVQMGKYHYVYDVHAVNKETNEKGIRTITVASDTPIGARTAKQRAIKTWEKTRLSDISKEWIFVKAILVQKRIQAGELFKIE